MSCIACGPSRPTPSTSHEALRAELRAHPRFPAQALLLGGHDAFMAISRELVSRTEAGAAVAASTVEALFRWWHRGMAGHEAYEERKLYPYLARRHGCSFEALVDDHERMHMLRDEVLRQCDADGEGAASPALHEALVRYDALLGEHLRREEAQVLPLLLELPPDEFTRYTRASIDELLRELPCDATRA